MKYTKSALLDTFDFIKRIIYWFDLLVQLGYIGYLIYRIIEQTGIMITNIILLVISFGHLLYHLITTREFYTTEQVETKKTVKVIVKWLKRVVNLVVISLSIYQLAINPNISNLDILLTMMLVLGFMFSLLGDIIVKVINSKVQLIFNSLKYDLSICREEHDIIGDKIINFIINKTHFDISVDNNEIKQIKDANHRQEMKQRRKKVFDKKNN